MSTDTLPFRALVRTRSRVSLRVRAEQPARDELPAGGEAEPRRGALHGVAEHASPSVRGDFRIFALGNR
ncbi:MAG: hypothetical protein KY461_03485 [Actinobacteria bacterium]|nr:hypothetical protein [Actinomycetota bacterium]